ncbi:MAG: recombinase family protein [Bacilli bacterium]|nr:recombinase family protein [Bacilli bacterium]
MIVEDEAKVVKRIFLEYITGKTIRQIAKALNDEKITTKLGNTWTPSSIQGVLANEKYTGNSYLAKTYKADVLSKSRVKNTGQATKYYVENSHPAIITQELFDMVQEEKKE